MRLVTTVFAHYEKHRQLILEDIFASLARLPSSKRNLRSYRLNADESIQMVTALALQLIQCVVKLPEPPDPDADKPVDEEEESPKSRRERERNRRRLKAVSIYFKVFLSCIMRKPVYGVSDQVRHKPGCTTT